MLYSVLVGQAAQQCHLAVKKRTPPPEVETTIRYNEEIVAVGGRTLKCLDSSKQNPENTTTVSLKKKFTISLQNPS
jgi:hypothetical protein